MTIDEIETKIIELKAEREKYKTKADGEKIQLNGTFGKLSSIYSPFHSPDLFAAVTLTGQLSILMLIERAQRVGIPVVSANTDGIIFHCQRIREGNLSELIAAWEVETGFGVERTRYRALYSRDVNTYLALKEDGAAKRKGPIADPWSDGDLRGQMSKNPQMTVLSEACLRLARDGVPLETTVHECTDPRMFVTVIKVTGGATWRGHKLGRVVRYYWSRDGEAIGYANANRKVAKTDGAAPLMELTDALPPDLDFDRYCAEAVKLATDLAIIAPSGLIG
jgi:hypothetical protein